MFRTAITVVLSLTLAACGKAPTQPTSAPAEQPADGPTAAVPGTRDAKAMLADAKTVRGFAIYRQELAPHSKLATEIATSGASASGDPRIAEFDQINRAAMAKAGITMAEVSTLSSALSGLVNKLAAATADDADEADKEALAKAKQEFAQKHGQAALDNVLQCQKELLAAQAATMKAVLGK